MSRTRKDLKSHKKGFGLYGFSKLRRKMTPMLLEAERVTGKKGNQLSFADNDISQDNFYEDENNPRPSKHTHWHNAKRVRAMRRQGREERKLEKRTARGKMKRQLKKELKNLDK